MVYTHAAALLLGMAVAAIGTWNVQSWRLGAQIEAIKAERANEKAGKASADLIEQQKTAKLESKHAQDTIYNADALVSLKTGIADIQRRELGYFERLQLSSDSRAATYRAQAQADASARSDLANLAEALDGRVTAGLGVVAKLQGRLGERDAEVAALCEQVNIERRLNAIDSNQACVGM